MFEVAITKKPAEKAAKTSLLWQQTAFALTSNDLNFIVCDSKAVKWSFLLQLRQSFWSIPNPKWLNKKYVYIFHVAEADWLIPGNSICEEQWNCVLQIRRALNSKMAAIRDVYLLFFYNTIQYRYWQNDTDTIWYQTIKNSLFSFGLLVYSAYSIIVFRDITFPNDVKMKNKRCI